MKNTKALKGKKQYNTGYAIFQAGEKKEIMPLPPLIMPLPESYIFIALPILNFAKIIMAIIAIISNRIMPPIPVNI